MCVTILFLIFCHYILPNGNQQLKDIKTKTHRVDQTYKNNLTNKYFSCKATKLEKLKDGNDMKTKQ